MEKYMFDINIFLLLLIHNRDTCIMTEVCNFRFAIIKTNKYINNINILLKHNQNRDQLFDSDNGTIFDTK